MSWPVRILWRFVAAAVAAIVLGAGIAVSTDALAWRDRSTTLSRSAVGVEELRIDAELLAIEFTPTTVATIRVDATINAGVANPEVRMVRHGTILELTAQCSPRPVGLGFCTGVLRIALPANVDLDITTDLGDVTGGSLTAARVSIQSDTGDVTLDWDEPPDNVRAHTDGGRVRLGLPEVSGAYRVRTSTDSGVVRQGVAVSDLSARRVDVKTSTGDVTLEPRPG